MIYLDYAASTPLHSILKNKLIGAFSETGNPQSDQMGQLHRIIEDSKINICRYFNGDHKRLFFTSGATESISTAIIGAARFYQKSGQHIITFASEHSATLKACQSLEQEGFTVTVLPIQKDGRINYENLALHIRSDTILISVNGVCNETGLIQDLSPLVSLQKENGFMVHLDACQMIGKIKFSLVDFPFDFISLSSHKCYGPQGIGALYIAKNRHLCPIIHGSKKIRSGTMSVALIDLMGQAYHLAHKEFDQNIQWITEIREEFLLGLENIEHTLLSDGVKSIVNIHFHKACETSIAKIREGIYCQISSACSDGVSHVLKARLSYDKAMHCIRFSFGIQTNSDDIKKALSIIYQSFKP